MKPRYSSHQTFVDEVVGIGLENGIRTRDHIISLIQARRAVLRSGRGDHGLDHMDMSPKSLAHKISLTTSREKDGVRDIWCVHGEHRYVSFNRVRDLVSRADRNEITPTEAMELHDSIDDLQLLQDHYALEAKKCFKRRGQIRAVKTHATVGALGL
ncbi:MAG: hypothetical protein KAJ55_00110 [Anaerolineales bacterium]|nr:hypothetical protein [Anaerolineales bacterium]